MRLSAHFRERYLPLLHAPGTLEEVEYPGLVRELLAAFGIDVSDEELNRYLEAEHAAWDPAMQVGATSVALLVATKARPQGPGSSRARRIRAGCFAPTSSAKGSQLLDAVAFSSELGKRKPHPAIYEAALSSSASHPTARCSWATGSSRTFKARRSSA